MKYKPIRTRWIAAVFGVVVVINVLCEMADGNTFTLPRSLWLVPEIALYPIGLALASALMRRYGAAIRQRRQNRSDPLR